MSVLWWDMLARPVPKIRSNDDLLFALLLVKNTNNSEYFEKTLCLCGVTDCK